MRHDNMSTYIQRLEAQNLELREEVNKIKEITISISPLMWDEIIRMTTAETCNEGPNLLYDDAIDIVKMQIGDYSLYIRLVGNGYEDECWIASQMKNKTEEDFKSYGSLPEVFDFPTCGYKVKLEKQEAWNWPPAGWEAQPPRISPLKRFKDEKILFGQILQRKEVYEKYLKNEVTKEQVEEQLQLSLREIKIWYEFAVSNPNNWKTVSKCLDKFKEKDLTQEEIDAIGYQFKSCALFFLTEDIKERLW